MGRWDAPSEESTQGTDESPDDNDSWVASLPPSFLKYDYQGRVIRVDVSPRPLSFRRGQLTSQTFSKTLCPGTRLGWYTASSFFLERLTRISEATTSFPSGFSTLITTSLLDQWGVEGYIRWLRGIRAGYMMRRNWLCDALDEVFALKRWGEDAEPGQGGLEATGSVFCYDKSGSGAPVLSFIPPTGERPRVSSCQCQPRLALVADSSGDVRVHVYPFCQTPRLPHARCETRRTSSDQHLATAVLGRSRFEAALILPCRTVRCGRGAHHRRTG